MRKTWPFISAGYPRPPASTFSSDQYIGPSARRTRCSGGTIASASRVTVALNPRSVDPARTLLPWREIQHGPVDAVALPRRWRTVGKHVAEMAAAARAMHFRSRHTVAAIDSRPDRAGMRRIKTRPAGAGVELRLVGEELLPAARARKRPGALLGVERAASRTLRRVPAQDLILLGRQNPAPLFVGFRHREICHNAYLNTLFQSRPNFGCLREPRIVMGNTAPLPRLRNSGSSGLSRMLFRPPPAAFEIGASIPSVPMKSIC